MCLWAVATDPNSSARSRAQGRRRCDELVCGSPFLGPSGLLSLWARVPLRLPPHTPCPCLARAGVSLRQCRLQRGAMGAVMSMMWSWWFPNKEYKLVMVS